MVFASFWRTMDGAGHKSGLYKWQRQPKPRVQSRSQKVATTDDIQNWLQRVEQATSKAAEDVLAAEIPTAYMGRQRGREAATQMKEKAKMQDDAYNEAQELINAWMNDKATIFEDDFDLGDDPDLSAEPHRKDDLGSKARAEWDAILKGDREGFSLVEPQPTDLASVFRWKKQDDDPYADLYKMDEKEAVSAVLNHMMSRELVSQKVIKDLGLDAGLTHDPRTKMELRHKLVKENRAKREQAIRRQRQEAESKKEARLTARHIVMKEEKSKEMQQKREELEIKKQMTLIRKQMHEARIMEEEERKKQHSKKLETNQLAHEELARQEAAEREAALGQQQELFERRKSKLARIELEKARQAAENLRIMHRHFTAWYDIILARRLAYGKARALADWRLTLRVWNAWRSYVRSQHVTIETRRHEKNIVEETRKTEVARRHYYLATLRKHFNHWQDYVTQEQERKRLEQRQAETRSKMMNLLSAVAGGSLWSARNEQSGGGDIVLESVEEDPADSRKNERRERSASGARSGNSGDEVVGRCGPKIAWAENSSGTPASTARPHSGRSTVSTVSTTQVVSHGQKIPTQAWQITHRHAQMTKEEMVKITEQAADPDGDIAEQVFQHSDQKIRRRFGTQPWMNRHFSVNNMEHRFTAQQKLLREQQTALQEHKRIIQDLVLSQHQQQLLQQEKQNAVQVQAAGHSKDVGSVPGPAGDSHTTSSAQTRSSKRSGATSNPVSACKAPKSAQNHSEGGDSRRSERTTGRSEVTAAGSDHSETTSRTDNNVKYLQILKNMDERAADRARLKAERDAKKRQAEEQRLEKLKAEEEEMKRKAEEEKKARVSAFREKKRLEKQKEEEKQREAEQQRELTAKADDHYRKALMKFRVLLPMKRLVQMAHERLSLAQQHHNHCILRKAISAWKIYTDEVTLEKKELADTLHGYIVVRRCFRQWTRYKHRMIFLEKRADRFHRDMMLPKMFEAWYQFTTAEKQEELDRQKIADKFYPRSLQRKAFHAWRRLPQEVKRAAEREKMRAEMRKKVADLLPDFKPSVSVLQSTDSTL